MGGTSWPWAVSGRRRSPRHPPVAAQPGFHRQGRTTTHHNMEGNFAAVAGRRVRIVRNGRAPGEPAAAEAAKGGAAPFATERVRWPPTQ
jgi:hypothetical protein